MPIGKECRGIDMNEEILAMIQPYKGNYIRQMRKRIGHDPVMTTACGVIIENPEGKILLQQRRDNGKWGLPGGAMEIGEKFTDAAKREVLEETGIELNELSLFGIYSGEDRVIVYPNNDICCVTSIVFRANGFTGNPMQDTSETLRHAFFSRDTIPDDLNEFDRVYIEDWKSKGPDVIVR
jgi:8-oxo-dGTP pyrophosphatase MutT (NUDIX family)